MTLARALYPSEQDFHHAGLAIEPCNSFAPLPPMRRQIVGQVVESHNMDFVQFARCLPLAYGVEPATGGNAAALMPTRYPYLCAPQMEVSIERQFSRIVPAFPRSLARCFSRAPSHSDSAAHRALLLPDSSPNQRHWVPTPEKAPSTLGAGHTTTPARTVRVLGDPGYSRRFAQECPEGNPGKSKQEKNNGTL